MLAQLHFKLKNITLIFKVALYYSKHTVYKLKNAS